jgi:uncharacterized protein DUF3800
VTLPSGTKLSFYCDTSNARGHPYMVAGGILVRADQEQEISRRIQTIKDFWKIRGEMKWRECKKSFRDKRAYNELLDLLITLIRAHQVEVHTLIVQFANFDHKHYGRTREDATKGKRRQPVLPGLEHNLYEPPGSPESSAGKMLYQLILHRPVHYCGKTSRLTVYPDLGNDSVNLPKFRRALCASGFRKYGALPNCVVAIHPSDSAKHNLLQMVDMVIGAIAARLNHYGKLAPHKVSLARNVLLRNKHSDWTRDTKPDVRTFSVWNFKPRTAFSQP